MTIQDLVLSGVVTGISLSDMCSLHIQQKHPW